MEQRKIWKRSSQWLEDFQSRVSLHYSRVGNYIDSMPHRITLDIDFTLLQWYCCECNHLISGTADGSALRVNFKTLSQLMMGGRNSDRINKDSGKAYVLLLEYFKWESMTSYSYHLFQWTWSECIPSPSLRWWIHPQVYFQCTYSRFRSEARQDKC